MELNLTPTSLQLRSNMKADPGAYTLELSLIYNQFKSSLDLFHHQASLNFTSLSGISADSSVANHLGDQTMFLAHVTPLYPQQLTQFPTELLHFLTSSAPNLLSALRLKLTKALILLQNRNMIDIAETLEVLMELQTVGDRELQQLAYSHVIQSIRRMHHKNKNNAKNKALQNILFRMLQQEEEAKAKQALVTLADLHRRKVWSDERTSNAICMASFHPSSRIKVAAFSILLNSDKVEDGDSDDSDTGDGQPTLHHLIVLNKEAVYKASHKGTTSSKKKKKAKLQRIARSMKKQQRLSSDKSNPNYSSPLIHLKDAQGFAEKLLSRLQSSNENHKVKMMMVKVIARTVGLYQLIVLPFYSLLERYVQPRREYITTVLEAAVQACHEMVPPDAVETLFRKIVNQLVHERSPPEDITVGLNVVREICLRMPLLMTEELLQDLVSYRKSHEKAVSSASRSLLTLFREICPSLLPKKDRGRPAEVEAKPKAFGEVHVSSYEPFAELPEQGVQGSSEEEDITGKTCDLSVVHSSQEDDYARPVEEDGRGESDYGGSSDFNHLLDDGSDEKYEVSDDVQISDLADGATEIFDNEECEDNADDEPSLRGTDGSIGVDTDIGNSISKEKKRKLSDFEGQDIDEKTCDLSAVHSSQEVDFVHRVEVDGRGESDFNHLLDDGSDEKYGVSDDVQMSDLADGATEVFDNKESEDNADDEPSLRGTDGSSIGVDTDIGNSISKEKKRKFSDIEGQLNASDKSVRALEKSSGTTKNSSSSSSSTHDGILSNEDYNKIAELKAEKDARTASTQHNVKIPSSEELRMKEVDGATLEAHIKRKLSKKEKLALIRRAREERGKYQARAAIKKKKTGGLSNRQKEHIKLMPSAARKGCRIARTRQEKKKKVKQQRSAKQFRGRKAWK